MSDTCSNCKFWSHWRVVACTDDEPKALGHCVVETIGNSWEFSLTVVQGLTGEDFCCPNYVRETSDV